MERESESKGATDKPSSISTSYEAHIDIDFRQFLSERPTGFAAAVVVHEPPSTVGVIATTTIPSSILTS
ncbi:MAG: hypothetical protein ABW005_14315, partial [Burkholderiaceae bacterium]